MEAIDRYAPLCNEIRKKFRTMRTFAAAVGIHPSTLSSKLNGRSSWTFSEVVKSCEVLGIPLVDAPIYFPA